MKKLLIKTKNILMNKLYQAACIISIVFNNLCMITYAEENGSPEEYTKQITGPMNAFLVVIITVVQLYGVFLLVKALPEFIKSWQDRDNNGIWEHLKSIAAAVILMTFRFLLPLFGVNL